MDHTLLVCPSRGWPTAAEISISRFRWYSQGCSEDMAAIADIAHAIDTISISNDGVGYEGVVPVLKMVGKSDCEVGRLALKYRSKEC